eukprot:tig00021116_g18405.t1
MFRDGVVRGYFYELPTPGCAQVAKKSTLAFYAVRRGIVPGIYSIWDKTATYPGRECALAQVWRVPGVRGCDSRRFVTLDQAMDFLEGDGTAENGLEAIPHERPAGLKCPWQ